MMEDVMPTVSPVVA